MNVYNKTSPAAAYKYIHIEMATKKTFFDSHQLPIGSCKNIVKTQCQLYSFGLEFRPRYIILAHTMYTTISNICKETFYDSQEREFKTYCKKQECGQSRVVWQYISITVISKVHGFSQVTASLQFCGFYNQYKFFVVIPSKKLRFFRQVFLKISLTYVLLIFVEYYAKQSPYKTVRIL